MLFQQYDAAGRSKLHVMSAAAVETCRWTHVACVAEGDKAFVYIDGEPSGRGTRSGTPATSDDPLTFG